MMSNLKLNIMATTTLRRRDAINIIRHKTAFTKQQVEGLMISLNGGKVSFPYFKEIVDQMRARAGQTSFALSSKAEWDYVERRLQEKDLPAIKFAEFFCSKPETSALIRAELMKPKTTATQVKQFLADCLNREVETLDESTLISMMLPADFRDYNFYRTVLSWCKDRFGKIPNEDFILKKTIKDLIEFYSDE